MEECNGCSQEKELRDVIMGKDAEDNPIWGRLCDDCISKKVLGG